MAARKSASAPMAEFVSKEDAERMAQEAAGRVLMTMPEPEPEPPAEPDPDDVALANVLSELGSSNTEAKVNVYHLEGPAKNRAFIGALLPSEFSMEKIQTDFGPGDYEIRVYSTGGLLTRKVIKIAAPKAQAVLMPPQNSGLETGKIIETMQHGFEQMNSAFMKTLETLTANQPKPKTTLEMLQEMQMMRELLGGNQPAQVAPDPMKLFEMATTIADKIQPRVGEPGAGEVIMEAIKNFGPMLTQAAAQRQTPPALMPPNMPGGMPMLQQNPVMVPPMEASQTAGQTAPQVTTENDEMNFARRMYLNLLISNAEADNDPATYAKLMLDVAGETQALEFANRPDWFGELCKEEPRAANFRPWFDELRDAVLELTKPDETDITGGNQATDAPASPPADVF